MQLITTHVCMTQHLGVHGNLFGGTMLSWLDEAAVSLACQYCDSSKMVTVKINEVVFQRPVRTGQIIKIYGWVTRVGTTSVSLNIEARKHNPLSGKQKSVCTTQMTFVNVDDEGEPVAISEKVREKFGNSASVSPLKSEVLSAPVQA